MERAVTYSDHSTTVTTRYFTQATHKSYGPMTQLLPGPQCPNVTHVPTVLLQTSSPLLTPPFLCPPCPLLSFHAQPLCPFQHPLPPFTSLISLTHASLSVCLSVCLSGRFSYLLLTPLLPCPPLARLSPPACFVSAQHMLGLASHRGAAAGLVRFMSCEDGRLRSPPGISLCHQHLASTLPRTSRKYRQHGWHIGCKD